MIRTYSQYEESYTQNASEEVSMIKKVKIRCYGHVLSVILMLKKLLICFIKKIAKNKQKGV